MKALRMERRPTRFVAAYLASALGAGRGAGVGPLRLSDGAAPRELGAAWTPVTPLLAGICGSDLATVDGRASRSFESIVSFPFVPGHEIVGITDRDGMDAKGQAFDAGTPGCDSTRARLCSTRYQALRGLLLWQRRSLWKSCPRSPTPRTTNRILC